MTRTDWEIVLRVKMSDKAVRRLHDLEYDSDIKDRRLPLWLAGLSFCKWLERHGIKAELQRWTLRRPDDWRRP